MVSVMSLWLPIVVAAVIVFVLSSVIHMFSGFHKTDFRRVPKEDETMDALRGLSIPQGDYLIPCPGPGQAMGSPEFMAKMTKGPRVLMTIMRPGPFSITSNLVNWFIYCLVVGFFTAYVTGVALAPGTDYLKVFQIAGCVSFMGYSLALPQPSIWYSKSWATTFKGMVDGLIYGLMTAGTFGWLWPK